jgi:hypothetical protein
MSEREPTRTSSLPSGLLTALVCAALLIAAFVLETLGTPMPPRERWAALTTFGLLALAYTVQGSPELYDVLGRTVRHDIRTLVPLLLLLPVLYVSYSLAVATFSFGGLLIALAFVTLPTLAFAQSHGQRTPTFLDLVAVLYLLLSLVLGLVPELPLPQQGGLVGFFWFSAAPLLLLLLAARSWSGLGFTWFLTAADLRRAVFGGVALLLLLAALALALGAAEPATRAPGLIEMLVRAVLFYFLVALPQEMLLRGMLQNGITRAVEAALWRGPGSSPPRLLRPANIALAITALLAAGIAAVLPLVPTVYPLAPPINPLLVAVAALGYGWIYQQTGKVTASAVAHMLVVWCWSILFA